MLFYLLIILSLVLGFACARKRATIRSIAFLFLVFWLCALILTIFPSFESSPTTWLKTLSSGLFLAGPFVFLFYILPGIILYFLFRYRYL